jgi:twitching motility two-component system response regulator PilH
LLCKKLAAIALGAWLRNCITEDGYIRIEGWLDLTKILIVDDSPAEVRLMQSLLDRAGYSSVAIHDPMRLEQVIDVEQPSLILLDVVMPQRNGFQVCRDLKAHANYARIPVVIVTSKGTESDKFWGKQQGADGYVIKPFTGDDLLGAVRKLVGSQAEKHS